MNRSLRIVLAICVLMIVPAVIWTYHVHGAQNINGVPNQSMSGFTAISGTTLAVGGATPLNFEGIITSSSATPGSIGAGGCAVTNYTFAGVPTGAVVSGLALTSGTTGTNINIAAYEVVTSANTVPVKYCNNSLLATQTPTAGDLKGFFVW